MDSIGRQKWLFTHASVGGNMIEGMQTLHSANASRYQLGTATAGDGSNVYPPPASTVPGTIYDAARGNPGWTAKFTMFDNAVRTLGWRSPKTDIAMDKLCYIDQDANPTNYIAMMTTLETDFPGTVFVYATMPLESSANSANILRAGYNNFVRAHCQLNNRVLFDIADIESHDLSGNPVTFTNATKVYERMFSGYTSDGGHLNALGEQRVALGWYATAAAIASASAEPQWTTNNLPSGLIAWWQAESNMLDSVSSHDGTGSTAPTYGPGRFGQAFQFDGTNQSVMIPDGHTDLDGWTQFTLEAWVNFDSLSDSPGTGQSVLSKVGNHRGPFSGNFGYQFGFGQTATKLFCQFNTDTLLWPGYQTMVDVPFAISTNVWYHVAATYDHNAVK
ncbi:MAG TPA: LamG-like jellyroll fold domain-containing protein, partial [Candidatus Paceibacterota bacterium]|nr:LamG-like jellyroll fold domain-containing protein [Candidatus Paceibacterota bacterium]